VSKGDTDLRKSRFTEDQITAILREFEQGDTTIAELCWAHGISENTLYRWRRSHGERWATISDPTAPEGRTPTTVAPEGNENHHVSQRALLGIAIPREASAHEHGLTAVGRGGTMTQWHKDGLPLSDRNLADLALGDEGALCECAGVTFRFAAVTVVSRHQSPTGHHGTVVLTLRQLGAPDPHRAIDLVDYVDVNRFDAAASDDDHLILDEAGETASHAARRYVGLELFRRAEELVAGRRVA
jgi:putative transposase